ncbi:hypothetical protein [Microvirga yunnanensis]|uniref:hypothetical protein n=1 Tax=Microvirga yunnanensis TaxID=2953740 RepID=UPI0021C8655E|nr:hypothetical protein [Microvirga sp. HBU65207]
METKHKNRCLLEATVDLLAKELAADNKDPFTRSYLEKRLSEIRSYLADDSKEISRDELRSTKNIVSNLSYAIDQNAAYDDHAAQFYKAVIGDLKDELESACEDR